jgi:hypothetical protein
VSTASSQHAINTEAGAAGLIHLRWLGSMGVLYPCAEDAFRFS